MYNLLKLIKIMVVGATRIITGRKIELIEIHRTAADLQETQKPDKPKIETEHKIPFFGYEGSLNSIISFSVILATCYTAFFHFDLKPKFIKIVLQYDLLSVAFVFVALFVIDVIIPRIAKWIVEGIVDLQFALARRDIRRLLKK